jgi:uncharacterized membrane protein AbrB (regulator of aidB expression)
MPKPLPFIFIAIGILVLLVGILFNTLKWPDILFGVYSGPGIILIGVVLLIFNLLKSKE